MNMLRSAVFEEIGQKYPEVANVILKIADEIELQSETL